MTAAAMVSLHTAGPDALSSSIRHDDDALRRPVIDALRLAGGPELDAWLTSRLARPAPGSALGLLELSAARGLAPPLWCSEALTADDPRMVGAAVRTCVFGEPNVYLQTLEGLLYADSAVVRAAALIAALAWGSPLGASVLQRIVLDDPDASAQWLALYCALGGRREHERLLALLADPTRRARALFAVGFSGNAMLVDPLLTFLTSAHARERKLSAQSLSMITGLDILDAQFALAEQDDAEDDSDDLDADEDVELEPEDDLPEPNTRPFAKPAARGRPAQRPRGACSRASLSIAPA